MMIITMIAGVAMSCAPRTANRGNLPAVSQLNKLKVGMHSKEYVRSLLGGPSTVGTFDKEVWYYIGRRTEKWAFFEESVIAQQVVAVYFDPAGKIEHIQKYDKDDSREIDLVRSKTPTSGHELGAIEQIIGNFGRFNRPSSSQTYRY
tara:strand:+ start:1223 stop:1663 length:441 start_codon:yes stop_codon:yes gene_type:complete